MLPENPFEQLDRGLWEKVGGGVEMPSIGNVPLESKVLRWGYNNLSAIHNDNYYKSFVSNAASLP